MERAKRTELGKQNFITQVGSHALGGKKATYRVFQIIYRSLLPPRAGLNRPVVVLYCFHLKFPEKKIFHTDFIDLYMIERWFAWLR